VASTARAAGTGAVAVAGPDASKESAVEVMTRTYGTRRRPATTIRADRRPRWDMSG
jgi:hypothetical protein